MFRSIILSFSLAFSASVLAAKPDPKMPSTMSYNCNEGGCDVQCVVPDPAESGVSVKTAKGVNNVTIHSLLGGLHIVNYVNNGAFESRTIPQGGYCKVVKIETYTSY